MCFSPQRRAILQHLNFKKWSETLSFFTFWLGNVLLATAACNFSTSQLQKVVRSWCVLYIFTSKCASHHSGVLFLISPLTTWLRTRRFNEPTFRLTRHTNHWKNTAFRDFSNIWRGWIFFLLTFALLHLLSSDSTSSSDFLSSDLRSYTYMYVYISRNTSSEETNDSRPTKQFTQWTLTRTYFFQILWIVRANGVIVMLTTSSTKDFWVGQRPHPQPPPILLVCVANEIWQQSLPITWKPFHSAVHQLSNFETTVTRIITGIRMSRHTAEPWFPRWSQFKLNKFSKNVICKLHMWPGLCKCWPWYLVVDVVHNISERIIFAPQQRGRQCSQQLNQIYRVLWNSQININERLRNNLTEETQPDTSFRIKDTTYRPRVFRLWFKSSVSKYMNDLPQSSSNLNGRSMQDARFEELQSPRQFAIQTCVAPHWCSPLANCM